MHLLRPIKAKANGKTLCRQEMTPILIQESPVGLNTIDDALVMRLMFALQGHNLTKIVQSQDGRLTPVPGKGDHWAGGCRNMLDDVFL
jgi:hypothetical protein